MKSMRSFLFATLLIVALLTNPTALMAAGGNIFDSLQGEHVDGVSNQGTQEPAPSSQETGSQPATQPEAAQPQNDEPADGISYQIDQRVLDIIKAILQKLGGLPPGTRIVIIPPTGSTGTTGSNPGSSGTVSNPPPSSGSGSGPVRSTPEARAKFREKWGVNPVEGDTFWSAGQLQVADGVMAKLPVSFRGSTKEIVRERDISAGINPAYRGRVYGFVDSRNYQRVHMLDLSARGGSVAEAQNQFRGTMVHEMAHCFQFSHPDIYRSFAQRFWGSGRPNPPSVSGYGNTQPAEDFSESVRQYFQAGSYMRQTQPARYEFVRKYVMSGKEF